MAKRSKKGPTKEEKEALANKKKFETKWINKNCFDETPLKLDKASLTLKQLRYGILSSHDLDSIQIELDTIRLKSSWIEFILIMLSQLITDKSNNFKDTLGKYGVTNPSFSVEKIYGSYSFDKRGYKVYKIYDTGYYLELKEENRILFNSIVALIRALEIDPTALRFNIEKHRDIKETPEEKLKKTLNYNTEEATINEVEQSLIDGKHLVYIKLFDEITKVHRMDVALLAFCNVIYDKYGMQQLMSIQNDEETGICLSINNVDYPSARIKDSMLCVYTSGKEESIVTFISNSIDKLKINKENIKFGFKVVEDTKHEWEVD